MRNLENMYEELVVIQEEIDSNLWELSKALNDTDTVMSEDGKIYRTRILTDAERQRPDALRDKRQELLDRKKQKEQDYFKACDMELKDLLKKANEILPGLYSNQVIRDSNCMAPHVVVENLRKKLGDA